MGKWWRELTKGFRASREPRPGDGCCGCGGAECDVITLGDNQHPATEGWCWSCFDRSPALQAATCRVLRGRAHRYPWADIAVPRFVAVAARDLALHPKLAGFTREEVTEFARVAVVAVATAEDTR